ncbi:MAG: hypothetical protein U9N59_01530 [Campylobacterota bacterium]|nr:hypothetical protein [Campylobacterota bacterium]
MIKIHDIKPLVEIPDNSIYLYYGLILFATLFVVTILYLIYTFFKYQKVSLQKEYFKKLKDIDFNNQKETAYTISKYGNLLIKDERETRIFEELNSSLEEFKYKKKISTNISNDIKAQYDNFIEMLNVK